MKKIVLLCIALVFVGGCALLEDVSPENPTSALDPNTVQNWINVAVAAGQASQVVGTAIGNPALIGGGVLILTLAGLLGVGLLKKKKENN